MPGTGVLSVTALVTSTENLWLPENNAECDRLVLMRLRWYRTWQRIGLIAALLCGLTSCAGFLPRVITANPQSWEHFPQPCWQMLPVHMHDLFHERDPVAAPRMVGVEDANAVTVRQRVWKHAA